MVRFLIYLLVLLLVQSKLYQVVSMFRHGARYHLNSVYDGNSTKPVWGELTSVGMRQHQNLGKMLAKDYIQDQQFLSEKYNRSEIKIYSTQLDRTVQSAISQLYGMYPLGNGPWMDYTEPKYHLPPFNNKTDDEEQNFALPKGQTVIPYFFDDSVLLTDCKNWDALVEKNIQYGKNVYDEMLLTYKPFLDKMNTVFNITKGDMTILLANKLYDTVLVDKYLGRHVPAELTDEDFLNLRHLNQWFNLFKISQNLSKAVNTYKLKRIIDDFQNRIMFPDTGLKWTFLSCHDTDLSAMMLDLSIASPQCVQDLFRKGKTTALNCDSNLGFASSIIFELHSNNGKDYSVKIRKNGKYVYVCGLKSYECSFQLWKTKVSKIYVDTTKICESTMNEKGLGRYEEES